MTERPWRHQLISGSEAHSPEACVRESMPLRPPLVMCHERSPKRPRTRKDGSMKRSAGTQERDALGRPEEHLANAGTAESDLDRILADSFPASDPPPWTLGVARVPAKEANGGDPGRDR